MQTIKHKTQETHNWAIKIYTEGSAKVVKLTTIINRDGALAYPKGRRYD